MTLLRITQNNSSLRHLGHMRVIMFKCCIFFLSPSQIMCIPKILPSQGRPWSIFSASDALHEMLLSKRNLWLVTENYLLWRWLMIRELCFKPVVLNWGGHNPRKWAAGLFWQGQQYKTMLNANTFFLLTFIVKLQYSAQTHVPILSVVKHYFGINLVPYWLSNFIFRCAPLHKFIFLQLLLLNSAVYFGTNSRFFYFDFQTVQYFSTNSCLFIVCCKILQYFWHKFMLIYILLSKLRYFGTNWYSFSCQTSVFGTNSCSYILDCQTIFWKQLMFLYVNFQSLQYVGTHWCSFIVCSQNYSVLTQIRIPITFVVTLQYFGTNSCHEEEANQTQQMPIWTGCMTSLKNMNKIYNYTI